ncbi:MAG: Holliday junction resolvase RuvX [Clostridia bacterium]|nr:Holliday junction resolvase RuvX [Clostridia bacterium]
MGRILALDVGDVRVGVAVSDPMKIIASPLCVVTRKDGDLDEIIELARQNDVELIVCGLPKRLDNADTLQTQKVREYAAAVAERCGLRVVFVDERLTTVSAQRSLVEGNMRRDKRKQVVDKVAASLILYTYLSGL